MKRDALALAIAMTGPSVMTWLEFKVLPGGAETDNPALLVLFATGKVLQFGLPLLYVWWFERGQVRPAWPTSRGLGLGIAFGLVVGAGAIVLYLTWLRHTSLMADTPRQVYAWLAKMHLHSAAGFFGMAVFLSILHSFLEEYYWRWFVYGWLRRYLPHVVAMVASSLAFMAHHVIILSVYLPAQFWTLAVPFSLCVAGGGIVWAWLYDHSESLYAPWASHLLVDAALMFIGYEMVARFWME